MDGERLQALLSAVRAGETSVEDAAAALRTLPVDSLGYARLDTHRALRTGFPEVVFCPGKTPDQIIGIMMRLREHHTRVLATRCEPDVAEVVRAALPDLQWHALARLLTWGYAVPEPPGAGRVAVLAAGTADLAVAEEAAVTAELAGVCVERVWDVGVAGLHRVLAARPHLEAADAVVVVAGMEGALASVVGGLTDRPVIAVPTSVGYGASFGGLAALLTMLNGCAAGVAVMNIDNGFGAGHLAARIARRAGGAA
jgi:hypothetical protein